MTALSILGITINTEFSIIIDVINAPENTRLGMSLKWYRMIPRYNA